MASDFAEFVHVVSKPLGPRTPPKAKDVALWAIRTIGLMIVFAFPLILYKFNGEACRASIADVGIYPRFEAAMPVDHVCTALVVRIAGAYAILSAGLAAGLAVALLLRRYGRGLRDMTILVLAVGFVGLSALSKQAAVAEFNVFSADLSGRIEELAKLRKSLSDKGLDAEARLVKVRIYELAGQDPQSVP